jgi:hypothetical protein
MPRTLVKCGEGLVGFEREVELKRFLRFAFCVVLFVASACGSKLTEANFSKIENGMTREEVVAILGEPADSGSVGFGGFSGGMATWKDDSGTVITIQFVNDKVAGKQFAKSSD